MSQITFENLVAQIAAGTITAADIVDYDCKSLTSEEKQALLNALASKGVADATTKSLASLQQGILVGADVVVIPAFIAGKIQLIDTDATAEIDLTGTHQFVDDSTGPQYPEVSVMEWSEVSGKYYAGRTLTVPAGVTMLYSFVLKD